MRQMGRGNSKIQKATVLVEIFPGVAMDGHGEGDARPPNVRHAEEYGLAHKADHGGVHHGKGDCVCLAFDINPQDFFLWDAEGFEAFSDGAAAVEKYFFAVRPAKAPSKQDDRCREQGHFCVRVSLVPIPEAEGDAKSCGDIARAYFQKAKGFAESLKHRFGL